MKRLLFVLMFLVLAWDGLLAVQSAFGQSGEKNGKAGPVNLEKLNTELDEEDPFPALNGLYYATKKDGRYAIMVSKRNPSTQVYGPGKVYLSSDATDLRSPFWRATPQVDHLFYAANRIPDEKAKSLKNYDIVQ